MKQDGLALPSPAPTARSRVRIDAIRPELEDGRHPVKRVQGDTMVVETDLVVDGHDLVAGVLKYRPALPIHDTWREVPLRRLAVDTFTASFSLPTIGRWQYTVEAWLDTFGTWKQGMSRKVDAGQDVELELLQGAALVERAAALAPDPDLAADLRRAAQVLRRSTPAAERIRVALGAALAEQMSGAPDRTLTTRHPRVLEVVVDRPRARFSSWYEMFPRSCGPAGKHGTFRDAETHLPRIAEMGFDVLYLPPIHPIGISFRKGKNNSTTAAPGEPGSPWAIGSSEGGHTSVHPELGTLEDFDRFRGRAASLGLELALDIAFQVSPDHPYVTQHPDWFLRRPDGSIQYAENPPKKYQDVYPFNFECDDWLALWEELRGVFLFWIDRGVRIFRVDNPHTKPLPFWEWCIETIQVRHPDVIFLAEAFTRPKVTHALAKGGFTQSYTYFTWRTSKQEITEYLRQLTATEVAEFFRPNFWPTTPDILPEHLQHGGRAAFLSRLVLAGTLAANYGIYGPSYELMEHVARPGTEELLDNEKYELRHWDVDREDSLRHVIARLNRIRKANAALQDMRNLVFHPTTNDLVICYSKHVDDGSNTIVTVVNLDPHHAHSAWIELDLAALRLPADTAIQVHELLSDARYEWRGSKNFVQLDPAVMPAQVFHVRRFIRTENQFEYFL